jgi:murein DD-endopeptidase
MNQQRLLIGALLGSVVTIGACSLEPPVQEQQPVNTANLSPKHRAVAIAERMIGTPYRYGGNTPRGFDCSGLVYYAYSHAGYPIARDSRGQYAQTIPIDPRDLRPGDLLFFNIDGKGGHVGIYVGNGQFIHAPSSGKRVSYASMHEEYWRDHFVKAGRLR